MKTIASSIALTVIAAAFAGPALAGPNDFFGSSSQSAVSGGSTPPGVSAAADSLGTPPTPNLPGDYTNDEKRVQKKYKEHIKIAKNLIDKGEGMMKSKDERTYKKGKVLKDIGERRLAELRANNPYPELAEKSGHKIQ